MDGYPGRRAAKGLVASGGGSGHGLRETANTRDQSAHLCNKTRCNGRLNMRGNRIGLMENDKKLRPSLRSSAGKETIGSSCRTRSSVNKPGKLSSELCKKPCSHAEIDLSETSSMQDESGASELLHATGKTRKGIRHEPRDPDSRKSVCPRVGSSSIGLNTRSRGNTNKRPGVTNQDNLTGSTSKAAAWATSGTRNRYALGKYKCNSVSDVIASENSSSDSNLNRKEVVRRKYTGGESSSCARGKRISRPSMDRQNSTSGLSICASDTRLARNSLRENGSVSARTNRSSSNSMGGLSNQRSRSHIQTNETSVRFRQVPRTNVSIDMDVETPSRQFLVESSDHLSLYNQPSSGSLCPMMPLSSVGDDITRSPISRDSFGHCNIDGIAEVLLELERIEHEEFTYEQMLVLDSYLALNGLSFSDQHRDMRLDIDNMSYEELLALEERMGNVSTALSEEALSKCLKRSIYQPSSAVDEKCCPGDMMDVKCSICQEDFAAGDEMGNLQCKHKYHAACIHQWLQLKNWCPICKASAEL